MHELSIAYNLVEIASEAAENAGAKRVEVVRLRLGVLSGVVKDALLFGYELATAGTVLEGSRLEIEEVPVAIYCPACDRTSTLNSIQLFCCPLCGEASADLRQGRELEIICLELPEDELNEVDNEREQPTYS